MGSMITGLVTALTTPTDAPVVGTMISDVSSSLSNQLVSGFGSTIVYVVPTVVIFTAVGFAFSMLKTRRKPH